MSSAQAITEALRGRWFQSYGLAFCPAHPNERTPALSLADGEGGRILAHCFAGCTFSYVLDALCGLGLVARAGAPVAPDLMTAMRRHAEQAAETAKRSTQARAVWANARPIRGTPGETYLRGRGIICELPDTLRFEPKCWHVSGKPLPALVALVQGGAGAAVHRTYLRPDGKGKTEAKPAKAMLGAVAGGAVRLVECHGPLVVAEGIETALSLASGLMGTPAALWAALSTSGMKSVVLPAAMGNLIVASDGDEAGRAAAEALATRADALGWNVQMMEAPDGQDWNDVLQARVAA